MSPSLFQTLLHPNETHTHTDTHFFSTEQSETQQQNNSGGFGPTQLQCLTHVMLCSWVKRTSMHRVQCTVSLQLSTSVRNSDLKVHEMRRALLIRHKCQIMCLKERTGRSSCRHAEASYATLSADSDCCVSLFGLPAFSNCSGEKGAVKCLISFICVQLFSEFKFETILIFLSERWRCRLLACAENIREEKPLSLASGCRPLTSCACALLYISVIHHKSIYPNTKISTN